MIGWGHQVLLTQWPLGKITPCVWRRYREKAAEIHLLSLSPAFLTHHKRELTWTNTFPDALAIVGWWRRAASKDSHTAEPICRSGGRRQTLHGVMDEVGIPPFSLSPTPHLCDLLHLLLQWWGETWLHSWPPWGNKLVLLQLRAEQTLALWPVWGVSVSTTHRWVSVFRKKILNLKNKWREISYCKS